MIIFKVITFAYGKCNLQRRMKYTIIMQALIWSPHHMPMLITITIMPYSCISQTGGRSDKSRGGGL